MYIREHNFFDVLTLRGAKSPFTRNATALYTQSKSVIPGTVRARSSNGSRRVW